jgi:hypothetical protein
MIKKGGDRWMRRTGKTYWIKPASVVLLGVATVVTALGGGEALATPSSGFSATTLARGLFDGFDVFNQFVLQSEDPPHNNDLWLSMQKTKGSSDVYVQSNTWAPGGQAAGTRILAILLSSSYREH